MITRFLTEVRVAFNPFSPRSKPARLFLSLIPADAPRQRHERAVQAAAADEQRERDLGRKVQYVPTI